MYVTHLPPLRVWSQARQRAAGDPDDAAAAALRAAEAAVSTAQSKLALLSNIDENGHPRKWREAAKVFAASIGDVNGSHAMIEAADKVFDERDFNSTAGAEAQLQQVQESVAAMRARCVAVGSPQDAAEDAVAAAEAAVEQCNKLHAGLQANAGAHSSQASGEAVAFREAVADANNKAKVCTSVVLHKGALY